MSGFLSRVRIQKTILVAAMVLMFGAGACVLAQGPVDNDSQQAGPYEPAPQARAMSANELATLLAPIALYPDGLLGQVLVACTYPEQVAEAQQFLQQNGNLPTGQLMDAARQQNWDASVQLLVAFPDVVALLNRDMAWTTELGNAFLAQQADVMNVVQSLRADAQANGQLASTPQLSVNTEVQGDRSAIEIQPTDPQRMFVPSYDPAAVWGPPAEGAYPALPYAAGSRFADVIGTVANLAGLLPGLGLLGPRGWGWALGWLAQALFVNNSFFADFGFHGYGGDQGTSLWVRDRGRDFGGRHGGGLGNNSLAGLHGSGSYGRGSAGQGEGWRSFGDHTRATSGAGERNLFGRSKVMGGENFRGDNRAARGKDLHQFSRGGQTQSAGRFGQAFSHSQTARTNDRAPQRDYRSGGRNSYFANSAQNHGSSVTAARSFGSTSEYSSFANSTRSRTQQSPRNLTATRSWGNQPNFSSARMSSSSRGYSSSDRGYSSKRDSSSKHGASWMHGSSSHSFKQKAPKYKAPHYAKAHGGGHSSGGHSKRSHRG
jgi:hypothetical protein